MSVSLPQEYLEYIRHGNVTESFLSCDFPGYMQLWPLDKVSEYNRDYQVVKYAPGFLCFGDNGGGELLAFGEDGAVYSLPAIGMEPKYATRIAETWSEFERYVVPAKSA